MVSWAVRGIPMQSMRLGSFDARTELENRRLLGAWDLWPGDWLSHSM